MDEIKKRFDDAPKLYGSSDEIITASGVKVAGRYVLCDSGAVTPSHNPLSGFCKSIGFPTDNNGQTVNDRDYERDTDAQKITRQIADKYDNRALQSPVIVSEGIVLSGNGRTMAGIIAAEQNTDGCYISYLTSHAEKYGFSSEEVKAFQHPRVVFVTNDKYCLTAETFAMFNAQEIKSQSKTEQSVKLGKLVDSETFNRIVRNINQFDTIGDFYANTKASTEAVKELLSSGVISQMQYPEMFDGDSVSAHAKEILENVLIGKAFSSNPDAVRQITTYKSMRKNIITALAEISNNIALGDYSLERETAEAIDLVYCAKSNGYTLSEYTKQTSIFDNVTKADVSDTTVLMLADMVNHEQVTKLKRLFVVYNAHAKDAANNQTDMFSGGDVRTKEDILNDVKKILNYSTKKLDDHMKDVVEQRKHEARTSIFMEEAARSVKKENVKTDVQVGTFCSMRLPNGETMIVKYEFSKGSEAGIRLKGWKRMFVPVSTLSVTSECVLTLPTWWNDAILCYNDIVILLSRRNSGSLAA